MEVYKQEKLTEKEEVKRIHGWLIVFLASTLLVVAAYIGLAISIGQWCSDLSDAYIYYSCGMLGWTLYMIYAFWKLKLNAVNLAGRYLVCGFFVNAFCLPTGRGGFREAPIVLYLFIAYCVGWFLYFFFFSKQVRYLFPKEERGEYAVDKYWCYLLLLIPSLYLFYSYMTRY